MLAESVLGWVERVVAAQPSEPAVLFGEERWSYAELWSWAAEMARAIRGLSSYSPGCRVGLVGRNTPDYLAAYLGVIRAGAVVVPLNDRDSPEELTAQLAFLEASACLVGDVDGDVRGHISAICQTLTLSAMPVANGGALDPPIGDAPAVVLLTSGSTGQPKGVVHTQRTLLHAALQLAIALPFGRGEVSIAFLPFFASAAEQVFPTLITGGTLDVLPSFSVGDVCDSCLRATSFDCVPTIMARLIDEGDHAKLARLRWLSFASEPMPPSLLERWWEAFPQTRTFQFYGMTELLTISYATPELLARNPRTVGAAFPTSAVSILDPELRPVAPGAEGQVACKSPALMTGYWNDPAATRLALTDEGAICTGDIATIDDEGNLSLTGRLKDLIISGGLNIAPAEIESVACTHPRVAAAAVVGIPDDRWGETPVIVAVSVRGETLTPEEVLGHCRANLSGYKRPSAAVVVPSLPITGIGKSAKNALRKAILGGELEVVRAR